MWIGRISMAMSGPTVHSRVLIFLTVSPHRRSTGTARNFEDRPFRSTPKPVFQVGTGWERSPGMRSSPSPVVDTTGPGTTTRSWGRTRFPRSWCPVGDERPGGRVTSGLKPGPSSSGPIPETTPSNTAPVVDGERRAAPERLSFGPVHQSTDGPFTDHFRIVVYRDIRAAE